MCCSRRRRHEQDSRGEPSSDRRSLSGSTMRPRDHSPDTDTVHIYSPHLERRTWGYVMRTNRFSLSCRRKTAWARTCRPPTEADFCPLIRSDKSLMIAKAAASVAHTGLFICLCNVTSPPCFCLNSAPSSYLHQLALSSITNSLSAHAANAWRCAHVHMLRP